MREPYIARSFGKSVEKFWKKRVHFDINAGHLIDIILSSLRNKLYNIELQFYVNRSKDSHFYEKLLPKKLCATKYITLLHILKKTPW